MHYKKVFPPKLNQKKCVITFLKIISLYQRGGCFMIWQ